MRITISKTGPPLNHRAWKIIYLLCFLIGMCGQVKCEDTTTVHLPDRVTYEWPLITNLKHTLQMWRLIYGKPNRSHAYEVPDHEQPSPDTPQPPGRERQGQPAQAPQRPAFLLASVVPKTQRQGTDARRSHRPPAARSPGKRTLHKEAYPILRSGGAVWL
jgi:hypothetical protein